MKTYRTLFLMFSLIALLSSCKKDKCNRTYYYQTWEPVYMSWTDLRAAVHNEGAKTLSSPGKIWLMGNYVFVSEVNKGIHVIDNTNPASPRNALFINIPGNLDIATKGSVLYADSYVDLLSFDISNPENPVLINRQENVIPARDYNQYGYYSYDPNLGVIADWKQVVKTVESSCDQGYNIWSGGPMVFEDAVNVLPSNTTTGSANVNIPVPGVGGSMARFTVLNDYLYVVGTATLESFNVSNAGNPSHTSTTNLGWNVETIFPYNNMLFIGTMSGMHIMSTIVPSNPSEIGSYSHITSCDPVAVQGDYAYVTLRDGTPCQSFTNQLEVVNISNPSAPTQVAVYPMTNPHGLGIDEEKLFICDGPDGLKVYDATNPTTIADNMVVHFGNIQATDVIPWNDKLLMIGANGLYQYDYTDIQNIHLLSVIPVVK